MFFYLSFIRPTEDPSDSKLNYFLLVIYQADRRLFRPEIKLYSICHLSGRQKTLPTPNEMFFYFLFIRPTDDTSDSKVNVLPFFIYQADRRHFRLEIKLFSICLLSGRQKTLPTRNEMFFHLSFIRPTEDTSDSK